MPITRSQRQESSESFTFTTADGTGATSYYPSTATIEANTTHTEGTMDVSKPHTDGKPATHTAKSVRSSRPSSTSSRRKELTKAREELVKRQIELAAIRVAALEEESDEESIYDEATVREDRTSAWIHESTLTLAPNNDKVTHTQKAKPTCTVVNNPEQCPNKKRNTCANESQPARIEASPVYNTAFNYNELANAITLAARCTQPLTRVQELPLFSGASSDWLPFKVAYEESASACSEQENLGRLRRSLKGAAKDAAQCLFVGNTTTAEVIKLLTSRFGRPDALVTAEINKLRALPRLNDNPRDTCVFASRIFNVTATIKALNKRHYLYNAEVVREVIDKLPSTLRHRYYDFIAEQPEEQPDLITLSKFFERTAERCGNFAPAELIASENRREHRNIVRSYHSVEKPPMNKETCPICKIGNHHSNDCKKFKDAEVATRWDIAKQYKLCFRCLRIRKFRHSCKTRLCEQGGCHNSHHPLLHRNKAPGETGDSTPASDIVTSAKDNRHSCAFLKILPVELTGPKGSYRTYALLDDGSTCTLIEAKMAEKIGVTGSPAPLYLEGVAGSKISFTEAKRVCINICGNSTPSYNISARTIEDLHLSPQTVSREIVRACQHLKDIETQLTYEEGKPTVIIGQDNWPLLIPHTMRRGSNFEPVASLTNLGWVIHGTRDIDDKNKYHRSHLLIEENGKASNRNIEKMHRLPAGGLKTASYKNDRSHSQLSPSPILTSGVLGSATTFVSTCTAVDTNAHDKVERISTLSTHRVRMTKKRRQRKDTSQVREKITKVKKADSSAHNKASCITRMKRSSINFAMRTQSISSTCRRMCVNKCFDEIKGRYSCRTEWNRTLNAMPRYHQGALQPPPRTRYEGCLKNINSKFDSTVQRYNRSRAHGAISISAKSTDCQPSAVKRHSAYKLQCTR